jgi:hypothetical protein
MVTCSCSATREDGVTLVTGRVENPGEPRRVRLESRLDGPLWPPRCHGVPAAGWDDEGFECVLAAGETRPIGAASPAPPTDSPLEVVETEPVEPDDGIEPRVQVPSVDPTAEDVVRELGAPRPPRDAVPVDRPDHPGSPEEDGGAPPVDSAGDAAMRGGDGPLPDRAATDGADAERTQTEESIDADLDAVAARIDTAERLSATTRLPVATEILGRVGGVAGARELDDQLSRDARRLEALSQRAAALAERAERATVPVEALDRVR